MNYPDIPFLTKCCQVYSTSNVQCIRTLCQVSIQLHNIFITTFHSVLTLISFIAAQVCHFWISIRNYRSWLSVCQLYPSSIWATRLRRTRTAFVAKTMQLILDFMDFELMDFWNKYWHIILRQSNPLASGGENLVIMDCGR